MFEIFNLTQHPIHMANEAGEVVKTYPASGLVAVCEPTTVKVGELEGFDLVETVLGEVRVKTDPKAPGGDPFPAPQDGVLYLVGYQVAQKLVELGRTDVIGPDTGATAVRKDGQVVAVRRFQRATPPPKPHVVVRRTNEIAAVIEVDGRVVGEVWARACDLVSGATLVIEGEAVEK